MWGFGQTHARGTCKLPGLLVAPSSSLARLPHGAARRLGRRGCRAAAKCAKAAACLLLLLSAPHMKGGGRACWRLAGVVAAGSRRYTYSWGSEAAKLLTQTRQKRSQRQLAAAAGQTCQTRHLAALPPQSQQAGRMLTGRGKPRILRAAQSRRPDQTLAGWGWPLRQRRWLAQRPAGWQPRQTQMAVQTLTGWRQRQSLQAAQKQTAPQLQLRQTRWAVQTLTATLQPRSRWPDQRLAGWQRRQNRWTDRKLAGWWRLRILHGAGAAAAGQDYQPVDELHQEKCSHHAPAAGAAVAAATHRWAGQSQVLLVRQTHFPRAWQACQTATQSGALVLLQPQAGRKGCWLQRCWRRHQRRRRGSQRQRGSARQRLMQHQTVRSRRALRCWLQGPLQIPQRRCYWR